MAVWKKVIVSGSSNVNLASLQVDNLTSGQVVIGGGASNLSTTAINGTGNIVATTGASGLSHSGSFSGSFYGDGSGLVGLVSTLGITGSDSSNGSVSLKTQTLTVTGASNEIDTTISGQTLTIGIVTNPTLSGNVTLAGNVLKSSNGTTALTLNGANAIVSGTLTVEGNQIKSSTSASAITLTGADVAVSGNLKLTGNTIQASDGNTNITLTSNTLTTFAGDIKISGNDIQSSAGTSVITLSGTDATVNGSLTVTNDLFVNGNTTYLNVANLAIEDKFILLSSGSTSAGDAGLVVDFGGGSGSVFAYDSATSRWGLTGSFNASGSAYTPDAYVASVVTTDIPAYQQVGNIRVQAGEIYIYV